MQKATKIRLLSIFLSILIIALPIAHSQDQVTGMASKKAVQTGGAIAAVGGSALLVGVLIKVAMEAKAIADGAQISETDCWQAKKGEDEAAKAKNAEGQQEFDKQAAKHQEAGKLEAAQDAACAGCGKGGTSTKEAGVAGEIQPSATPDPSAAAELQASNPAQLTAPVEGLPTEPQPPVVNPSPFCAACQNTVADTEPERQIATKDADTARAKGCKDCTDAKTQAEAADKELQPMCLALMALGGLLAGAGLAALMMADEIANDDRDDEGEEELAEFIRLQKQLTEQTRREEQAIRDEYERQMAQLAQYDYQTPEPSTPSEPDDEPDDTSPDDDEPDDTTPPPYVHPSATVT